MNGSTLRKLILLFTTLVFLTQACYCIIIFLNSSSSIARAEVPLSNLIAESVTAWILTLPIVCLGLWAAHNLKPLKTFSDEGLSKFLNLVAVMVAVSALASLIVQIVTYRTLPHFPNLPSFNAMTVIATVSWLFYSMLEVVILFFAAWQLRQKVNNKSLSTETQEASVGEADPGT